jgi:hypothetical protein
MVSFLIWLPVLATESGIPTSDWRTQLAVPIGVTIFFGSIYLLLRSNLGTRRAYLLLGTCVFGFLTILALFWSFGAPGTPQATGPTNLPGQVPNEYQPTWVPFAVDSLVADMPEYSVVKQYPEGFSEVPEGFAQQATTGADEIQTFFASAEGGDNVEDTAVYDPAEIRYAVAENGRPIIAVTYRAVNEAGGPDPAQEPVTFFGFFDAGNPIFPSLVVLGIAVMLFVLHAFLLDRDEQRERRERAEGVVARRPRVSAGA